MAMVKQFTGLSKCLRDRYNVAEERTYNFVCAPIQQARQ